MKMPAMHSMYRMQNCIDVQLRLTHNQSALQQI